MKELCQLAVAALIPLSYLSLPVPPEIQCTHLQNRDRCLELRMLSSWKKTIQSYMRKERLSTATSKKFDETYCFAAVNFVPMFQLAERARTLVQHHVDTDRRCSLSWSHSLSLAV